MTSDRQIRIDLEREISEEPDYSCPQIDSAQAALQDLMDNELEKIRLINDSLRSWGSEWRDKAVELAIEKFELEGKVSILEDRVKELEAEVEGFKVEAQYV